MANSIFTKERALLMLGLVLFVMSAEVFDIDCERNASTASKPHPEIRRSLRRNVRVDPDRCDGKLEIHLVPHSHDDAGWLKTYDEYYWGEKYAIQRAGVQYILDSVVHELDRDPTKKFVYCEIAFFQRWWRRQPEATKDIVKRLVSNGQLEFVNGGFVMNDEATCYYEDIFDQMTIGHQFLLREFGVRPTIGWQLDPFGHSSAQASLFAQMGFDAMFFSRMDYQDKAQRRQDKALESVWTPQTSQGYERQILTHMTYNMYEAPPTFCFDDLLCEDPPIIDDPEDPGFNIEERATTFVKYFRGMCNDYRTNTLFHTMGSDFQYSNAHKNFVNMERLRNYVNSHPELHAEIKFSTPSEYVKSLNEQKVDFPNKTDDYFPYADIPDGYWTGYFTSRPALKGLIRELGRFSQAFKKLVSVIMLDGTKPAAGVLEAVEKVEEAMAINQHHDAVTGTARQHVSDDYVRMLVKAKAMALEATETVINGLSNTKQKFATCDWNTTAVECNISSDALKNGHSVYLRIFNPAHARKAITRVKVPHGHLMVYQENGQVVNDADVICIADNDCDLFFEHSFEQYALSAFELRPNNNTSHDTLERHGTRRKANGGAEKIELNVSDELSLVLGHNSNELEIVKCSGSPNGCLKMKLSLGFRYYASYVRKSKDDSPQNSGPYIFRPNAESIDHSLPYAYFKKATIFVGTTVTQIDLDFGERVNCSLRIYRTQPDFIELESFINSLHVANNEGKEVVLEIKSDIKNHGVFYTDSAGLEMQRRRVNFRETWDLEVSQPIAGNYYPITSAISIEDDERRLTVLTDRAQGGGSFSAGQIEIMVHRRILADDDRGMGEPMNEVDADKKGMRQRVRHYLVISSKDDAEVTARSVQSNLDQTTMVLLSLEPNRPLKTNAPGYGLTPKVESSLLKTFIKPWNSTFLLFRVQNLQATEVSPDEHEWMGEEMSLTGNNRMKDVLANKYRWVNFTEANSPALRPLEIKTFLVPLPTRQ